jgi:cardiolipin synthase
MSSIERRVELAPPRRNAAPDGIDDLAGERRPGGAAMQVRTIAAITGGIGLVTGAAVLAYRHANRHEAPKEGLTPGVPTYPWVAGNRAELLVDYREFVPRVLEDLRAAEHVINIVEYNWEPSGPSLEIAKILKDKVREGVEVNVMTDRRGSFGFDSTADAADVQRYFDDLEDAGVNVIVTDPGGNVNPFGLYLDHRKLFDIDHRVAHVGGLGLASTADGKYDDWHDLMIRIEGPAAAQAGAEFVSQWQIQGGQVTSTQQAAFASAQASAVDQAKTGASARMLPNTPGVGLDATEDFMAAAAGPGERLWAMTPYVGDRQVQRAMIEAAKAGKDVRLLVPGPESRSNGPLLQVSRTFYRDLLEAGVRVYEYPEMMHAKAWVTDDQLTVGSTNLSDGALDEYLELSAAVKDDPVTLAKAERMLEADLARSRELTLDDFGAGDRVKEFLREVTFLEF